MVSGEFLRSFDNCEIDNCLADLAKHDVTSEWCGISLQ